MRNYRAQPLRWILAAGLLASAILPATTRADVSLQDMVNDARSTLANFNADPDLEWFRNHIGEAKAVLIIPTMVKAGFFIGGSGGGGVLIAQDSETGQWRGPAFYSLGAGSIGLQFGIEAAEIVLLVMTESGLNSLLSTSFKLGADASIAAGPVGAGTGTKITTDIVSFARSKGIFLGVALDGAVIRSRDDRNEAYYGRAATAADILIRGKVANTNAAALRTDVAQATGREP